MLTPLLPDRWDPETAAHLALRAGFGQTPDESKKWSQQGLEVTLNHLLQTPPDNLAPPAWAYPTRDEDLLQRLHNPATTVEDKVQVQRDLNIRKGDNMADLISWWTLRMCHSPAPFIEKMTLFWHGHFATSAEKVSAYRMWLQNETIRRYALSNFGTLVKAISCDPAMIAWLDLGASQKEHPNENFARALMELFTLGEGHYTEDDVKTAARAFTGYRVAGPDDQFRFVANQFDPSEKTFLGKTGPWRGDQVIDIILAQPQCAKFIATKIWRFFAYDDPSPELVDALSGELRRCGYELKPFMKVGLPKGPSATPTPAPALDKAIAAESSMAETALKALGDDAGSTRVANVQNTRNPAQSRSTPAHNLAQTPAKTPVPQVIPPPAPTPPPRLTGGLPIGRIITGDDRKEPRRVVEKLSQAIFQATPETVLFEKFVQVIATDPVPFDDRAIRELAILMMSTPNYQLC
jgi:uncharacterized protein (DUF1800 family)